MTCDSRITLVTDKTCTDWRMIDDIANSILTTNSWTRINTFLIHTSTIRWTFRIHGTLWTTFNIWITYVFRNASTWTNFTALWTNCIYTAWCWMTNVNWFIFVSKILNWINSLKFRTRVGIFHKKIAKLQKLAAKLFDILKSLIKIYALTADKPISAICLLWIGLRSIANLHPEYGSPE